MKNIKKLTGMVLSLSLVLSPVSVLAAQKTESVYTKLDYNGKKQEIRVREELAIAFQHEIDHLNGILFFDHIDSKNPYKDEEKMRMI